MQDSASSGFIRAPAGYMLMDDNSFAVQEQIERIYWRQLERAEQSLAQVNHQIVRNSEDLRRTQEQFRKLLDRHRRGDCSENYSGSHREGESTDLKTLTDMGQVRLKDYEQRRNVNLLKATQSRATELKKERVDLKLAAEKLALALTQTDYKHQNVKAKVQAVKLKQKQRGLEREIEDLVTLKFSDRSRDHKQVPKSVGIAVAFTDTGRLSTNGPNQEPANQSNSDLNKDLETFSMDSQIRSERFNESIGAWPVVKAEAEALIKVPEVSTMSRFEQLPEQSAESSAGQPMARQAQQPAGSEYSSRENTINKWREQLQNLQYSRNGSSGQLTFDLQTESGELLNVQLHKSSNQQISLEIAVNSEGGRYSLRQQREHLLTAFKQAGLRLGLIRILKNSFSRSEL